MARRSAFKTSKKCAAPAGADGAAAGRQPGRTRRTSHRFRWTVRWLVALPVAAGLLVLLAMRSPLVGSVAASRIGSMTGCTVEGLGVGGAAIDLDGNLILDHFALRVPGVPGDAGEVLSCARAVVDLDWSGVLMGRVRARSITLTRPVFTLSQGRGDGRVNVSLIQADAPAGGAAEPPSVDAVDARVVFGEHGSDGRVRALRVLDVAGSLTPAGGPGNAYVVRLSERGRSAEKSLLLDGRVDLAAGAAGLKLYNLSLDAWGPESVPSAYRALWRRLDVQGALPAVSLAYDARSGVRTEVSLEGVAMNVPVEAPGSLLGPGAWGPFPEGGPTPVDLSLSAVSGTVGISPAGLRAELRGRIAGQAGLSRVVFETRGTDVNAPLTCEIVAEDLRVEKDAQLLPYMPEKAKEYLRAFGGPEAVIRRAGLVLSRGEPQGGRAAPLQVSGGRVTLANGTAAFHRFPYPISALEGEVEFDDEKVVIVGLRGRGPTGAVLTARGIITPLTEESMVDVSVSCRGVPIDEHLLAAMPPDRRAVLDAVFSRPEHERLVAEGLVRDPVTGRGPPGAPPFALGGPADIDVHVHSPLGRNAPWFTTVDVAFPDCGVLVDAFPLPVRARGVRLHVTDDDASLVSGSFEPIAGGTLELSALVRFVEAGRKVVKPDVRVTARGVPIDRFVAAALPGMRPGPVGGGSATGLTAHELYRRLRLSGTLDATAAISEAQARDAEGDLDGGDGPEVNYRVQVDVRGVRAAPALGDEPAPFALEDLSGTVVVRPEEVRVDGLRGLLVRTPAPGDEDAGVGPRPGAGVELSLRRGLERGPAALRGVTAADVRLADLDLSEPVERLVRVFSPSTGDELAGLRDRRRPSGRLRAVVSMGSGAGEGAGPDVSVRLESGSAVEVAALGRRVGVDWPEGAAEVRIDADGSRGVRLDGVTAGVWLDGLPCGVVRAGGSLVVSAEGGVLPPADLRATLDGWRFDSPLLPPLLETFTDAAVAERYRSLGPAGEFDAALRLSSVGAPAGRSALSVALSPRRAAFTVGGERVDFRRVEGRVTLEALTGPGPTAVSGRLEGLRASTAGWTAGADGSWSVPAGATEAERARGLTLDVGLTLEAGRVDAPLLALLPGGAGRALGSLEARFDGPVSLVDARVRTTVGMGGDAGEAAGAGGTTFNGRVRFENASLDAGVSVQRASGTLDVHVDDRPSPARPGAPATSFVVGVHAGSLRIAGVTAHDARATVTTTDADGEIVIPDLTAEAHGGRVSGRVRASRPPAPGGAGRAPLTYEASVVMAGVRLAPVLSDFAAQGVTDPGPVGPPDPFAEPDPSRGVVDARLAVRGVAGDGASRAGEGAIRVVGGDVLRLPLMLPLVQVSNLQLPKQDRLSYLQSDFRVQGERAVFDHVALLSRSVAIMGGGTLSLDDYRVDMRFNSKGLSRMPVLSDVLEMVRDGIVTTRVTGRLADPSVSAEPLGGTRRLLDAVLNPGAEAAVADLLAASRAAQAERERVEGTGGTAVMPTDGR